MELTYQEVYHMNPTEARKRIIHIYQQTQNYCETARRCHTSPQLVRKWVKRYQQYGEQGLHDLPKTPKRQPRKTDPDIEQRVLQRHQKTHYGRQRLARHLAQHGIHLSPNTIRHILKRHAPATSRPRKPRRRFYPAHWAWESQEPFTLIQADVKAIYDKGTLGTERWDHLRKRRLPRYQWTFLESRTRLRLLAFSREISTLHGMAFLSLAVSWLRLCGVPTEMTIQTDWGEERGGSNPDKIARLEAEFLRPLGAQLGRIPLGRKEYNGRVERSHRTDDEEFYLPCVLSLDTVEAFLGAGLGWLYHYNYERVHSGYGMEGRTPYGCCVALGFEGSAYVGLMPVVLLDDIVLEWSRQGVPAVNDVLTHYIGRLCGGNLPLNPLLVGVARFSRLVQVCFQFLAEQFAGAVQARFDRRLCDAQPLRRLFGGEFLDIAQHQHGAQRIGQLCYGLLHALAQVVLNHKRLGVLRVLVNQLAQDGLPLFGVQWVVQRVEAV
ncbi:helix-turn-helix domain-containing protein [Synechococcus sp. RC10B2]